MTRPFSTSAPLAKTAIAWALGMSTEQTMSQAGPADLLVEAFRHFARALEILFRCQPARIPHPPLRN